jgi:choline-sulfatase
MGSKTAAYMLRKGPYKLVYYADYEPQLFDLASDPEELKDIAEDANAKSILDDLKAELYRRAKRDQERLLAEVGGKEFVIKRGDLGFSPPPGVPAQFS